MTRRILRTDAVRGADGTARPCQDVVKTLLGQHKTALMNQRTGDANKVIIAMIF